MWWNGQNLDKPLTGPDGRNWHFRIWQGTVDGVLVQRIFFWDESGEETGLIELHGSQALHITKLKDRMIKLVRDESYRMQFLRELQFPLERYWD
jgi:hypothetical protein